MCAEPGLPGYRFGVCTTSPKAELVCVRIVADPLESLSQHGSNHGESRERSQATCRLRELYSQNESVLDSPMSRLIAKRTGSGRLPESNRIVQCRSIRGVSEQTVIIGRCVYGCVTLMDKLPSPLRELPYFEISLLGWCGSGAVDVVASRRCAVYKDCCPGQLR